VAQDACLRHLAACAFQAAAGLDANCAGSAATGISVKAVVREGRRRATRADLPGDEEREKIATCPPASSTRARRAAAQAVNHARLRGSGALTPCAAPGSRSSRQSPKEFDSTTLSGMRRAVFGT
jgi:hypothetical protein